MIRVVHCPTDVGSHPSGLVRAERALGLDSTLLVLGGRGVRRELSRYSLLARTLARADVVHFNFGSSLLPRWYPPEFTGRGAARRAYAAYASLVELRDLPLLRRAGKRIFVTYQGDDIRQAADAGHAPSVDYFHPALDERKRAAAARFDRYSERTYALNPDLLAVLGPRAEFLPYASVDLAEWLPSPPRDDGPLRVVHAPSDRRVKGTEHLLAAVERLRGDGVGIELDLVEGLPRREAHARYELADVLVDQLLTGWYGSVSVELMALGRPAIAHLRERDLGRIPDAMREQLPVIEATPASIEEVLRTLAGPRRGELAELGRRSRAFVERWHDPLAIARRTKADYERALGR